ncbi:MAG: hypothetical protein V7727_02185 [Sneathiella sp.]
MTAIDSHCRISRIKFKSGGEIVPLRAKSEMTSLLMKAARNITIGFKDELEGYVVVGWDKDAEYSIGYRVGVGPITPTLMPSWLHDLVLRQVTENGTIEELQSWEE